MRQTKPILLIIAADYGEAFELAKAHGLTPLQGHVRTIVRPQALRGWSHGTPAIIGRMADWPDTDALNDFCKCIEAARQRGWIRMATDADIAGLVAEALEDAA